MASTSRKRSVGERSSQCAATKSNMPAATMIEPNAIANTTGHLMPGDSREVSNALIRATDCESRSPASTHRCSCSSSFSGVVITLWPINLVEEQGDSKENVPGTGTLRGADDCGTIVD